ASGGVCGVWAGCVWAVLRVLPFVRLRPARLEDSRFLWQWANDPEVGASSFSPDSIPWEAHVAWFSEKLEAAQMPARSAIFIAEDDDGAPVGQVRFDARRDGGWEVDVSIAKAMRGRKLATPLIENGVQEIWRVTSRAAIHA